jgi:ribose transport system ATP-binding protein
VTVLRDGSRVATESVAGLTHDRLVELIVGRPLEEFYPSPPVLREDVALDVAGLQGLIVQDASLRVHAGEIVGVTGLMGSGRDELMSLIFGARPRTAGRISVAGKPGRARSPREAISEGLAFAPADRKGLGGIQDWSIRENLTLPSLRPVRPLGWMSDRREREETKQWLRRFAVKPEAPEARLSSLSGGNQQKVVLAKWLRCGASVFMIEEPTAGVDVGAKPAIYSALAEVASQGAGVLLASSDAEEVASICDRVLVMRRGRIRAVLEAEFCTESQVIAESVRVDSAEMSIDKMKTRGVS